MDLQRGNRTSYNRELPDNRRHPRFKFEVDVRIYPRGSAVVRGHTVDLSESGISAMLKVEVPLGELVRLEFTLSDTPVEVHALVRQRNAFRYGFQFVDLGPARDAIVRTCRQMEMEESLRVARSS
jgi:hypothetical protein